MKIKILLSFFFFFFTKSIRFKGFFKNLFIDFFFFAWVLILFLSHIQTWMSVVLHATMVQVRRSHDLSYGVSCDFSSAACHSVWCVTVVYTSSRGARTDNLTVVLCYWLIILDCTFDTKLKHLISTISYCSSKYSVIVLPIYIIV